MADPDDGLHECLTRLTIDLLHQCLPSVPGQRVRDSGVAFRAFIPMVCQLAKMHRLRGWKTITCRIVSQFKFNEVKLISPYICYGLGDIYLVRVL